MKVVIWLPKDYVFYVILSKFLIYCLCFTTLLSDEMRFLVNRVPFQRTVLSRILSIRSASSTGSSTTKIPVPSDPSNAVYDEKSDMLQKIDIEDLPRAQKRFAKQFEKVNEERIKEIFVKNYKVRSYLYLYMKLIILCFPESSRFRSVTFLCCWNLLLYNLCGQARDILGRDRSRSCRRTWRSSPTTQEINVIPSPPYFFNSFFNFPIPLPV